MSKRIRRSALALAVELALPLVALAQSPAPVTPTLQEVVVTGAAMSTPLVVETDLKVPRQPLPAHDGADYLKTIPGFSVIRKGGTDGDPTFRGMAASRLNILVDGQNILGGCNFRMDAPTAYIFPEAYDKLTVIKGPQSVQHGAGNSAGVVLFEREFQRFDKPGYRLHGSLTGASFGRHDEVLDATLGNPDFYGQLTATNSQSGDYKDGDGRAVPSRYKRYSLNGAVGWTPDANTRLELSGTHSDGYARYADRGMDGTKFLREGLALAFTRKNLSPLVEKLEAQLYGNQVDHIMDDQELRTPGMMGYANLKRETSGGKLALTLRLAAPTRAVVGLDTQSNEHTSRSAPASGVYGAWTNDASFRQVGLFGEVTHLLAPGSNLVGGLRVDAWKAKDERQRIAGMMMSSANPTAGKTRDDTLKSGFVRLEQAVGDAGAKAYAGLGHTERFPDYWEMIAKESATTKSAFDIQPERTNQLDAGLLWQAGGANLSASIFYNRVSDYILVDYSNAMKANGISRNIDATTYGGELGVGYAFNPLWKLNGSLAYVHGSNRTDGTALAQLPPLDSRISLSYDNKVWSAGALLRLVAAQKRYDLNKGNIVGKDLGPTSGFAVFSINAGWRPSKSTLISAGIDNLFDRNYAEFVSRAAGNGMGGVIPGYVQTLRVNEPGRTAWLKATVSFD